MHESSKVPQKKRKKLERISIVHLSAFQWRWQKGSQRVGSSECTNLFIELSSNGISISYCRRESAQDRKRELANYLNEQLNERVNEWNGNVQLNAGECWRTDGSLLELNGH